MAVVAGADLVDLLVLLVVMTALGEGILSAWEWVRRQRLDLTHVERPLVAFYAAGGLLYVLAYAPLSLFTRTALPVVLLVLMVPGLLLGLRRLVRALDRVGKRSHGGEVDPTLRRNLVAWALVLVAFLGLLVFEVLVVGSQLVPNTYDGSVQTDFVALLFAQGHAPLALYPIAPMGVIYPQGTAVWMGSAAALFGWPAYQAPVLLPPLFLALSVPAAFAWGTRAFGLGSARGSRAGLLFAIGVAVLLTWPRFLVAGSYDFLFALPLFLLALGWLQGIRESSSPAWESTLFLALGVGVMASLSPVPAELFVVLLVAVEVLRPARRVVARLRWLAHTVVVAAVGAAFELPTFLAFDLWWSFPGHVLTPVGGPVPASSPGPADPWGSFVGLVDPLLFRPQDVWLSPFPVLKVEIAALFAVGVLILGARWTRAVWAPLGSVPRGLARKLLTSAAAAVVLILVLSVGPASSAWIASLGEVISRAELSILLFVMFGAVAMVPLLLAWEELERSPLLRSLPAPSTPGGSDGSEKAPGAPAPSPTTVRKSAARRRSLPGPLFGSPSLYLLLALLVIAVPLSSGVTETVVQGPAYLQGNLLEPLANVTPAEMQAVAWMGSTLPSCSGVLVSPGSAGEFLPSYNPSIRVLYPLVPMPKNFSYDRAVAALTADNYTATTRADLLALAVTEVYVAPPNNHLWAPFALASFLNSSDFTLVYPTSGVAPSSSGQAYVFAFEPEIRQGHCGP